MLERDSAGPERKAPWTILRGRLQVETALDAVSNADDTRQNRIAKNRLSTYLAFQTENGTGNNHDLLVSFNDVSTRKAILEGLSKAAYGEDTPDDLRIASDTLFDILTSDE